MKIAEIGFNEVYRCADNTPVIEAILRDPAVEIVGAQDHF